MFFEQMHPTWQYALGDCRDLLLLMEVKLAGDSRPFMPVEHRIMRAFEMSMDDVKVLLVGQDPYPTENVAIGLSFAVDLEVSKTLPRSLQNILKEVSNDLGPKVKVGGDLSLWASQGVMLLNRHLTVPIGAASGHDDLGWARFTDKAVAALAERHGEKLVAILWGKQAAELEPLLGAAQVIRSAHPSPLSAARGFFGSKPFSKTNEALKQVGRKPVKWDS
ncbi:MAG: uracil-DNA glycosylase [Micrococcales bacterium]